MMYKELTSTQKSRFRKNRNCSICGELIYDDEALSFNIRTVGRCKIYNFFHLRCKNEQKEEIKAE